MSEERPKHSVAACALVTRDNGDVLMVKVGYRDGWEIPGGAVELGEDALHGAIRETLEETGITARITHMTGVYTNIERNIMVFAFLGEYVSGEPTPSDETPQVAWVKREDVMGLIEDPTMIARVRDMLNFDGEITYRTYTKNPYRDVSVIRL